MSDPQAEARNLVKWLCRQGRLPKGATLASVGRALDAALLRERAALDDPFLRYRDSITETLKFISTHAGSGDYSQVIADMATELLADLGVE